MIRRLLFLILAACVVYPVISAPKKGASIECQTTEFNLGTVSQGGGERTFTLVFGNDGSQPVVVMSVRTSCSCLKAKFSRKPVPVGGKGVVNFTLESSKMEMGVFHRVIQVKTNAGVTLVTAQGTMVP